MRERESLERELHPILRITDPSPPPSTIMTEDTPLLRRERPNVALDSEHAMYERM